MGNIQLVANVIDENALYVEVEAVDEEYDNLVVSYGHDRHTEEFAMMRGLMSTIVRETGMFVTAIDATIDGDNTIRLWFSEPEIGARGFV